jgi:hypothetical protein
MTIRVYAVWVVVVVVVNVAIVRIELTYIFDVVFGIDGSQFDIAKVVLVATVLGRFEHKLFVHWVFRVYFAIAKLDHLAVYGVGRRLIAQVFHYRLAIFVL